MKRYRITYHSLMLLLFLLLPVACNQANEAVSPTAVITPIPSPTTTPTPLPDVLEVILDETADPEAYHPQTPFTLHFNQPMDPDDQTPSLQISPSLEGKVKWNADLTSFSFVPDSHFTPGKTYTISLTDALSAASGLTFDEPPHWQITILSPPKLIKRTPAGRIFETRRPEIQLTFSRPMDHESVAAALSVEPAIPLRTEWNENRVTLKVGTPLQPDTQYRFTISRTAADEDGIPLATGLNWTYQAPDIIANTSLPHDDRQAPIMVSFNYTMDPNSVRQAMQLTPPVTGDLSWNEAQTVFTFTPVAPLATDTTYELAFADALRDANGDPFQPFDPIFFTTPPPVIAHSPIGLTVHPYTTVEITFDRPMDKETTAAAFTITPEISGTLSWRETTLIFAPETSAFNESTEYSVHINPSALDASGEAVFNQPYTWSFKTEELQEIASFGWGPNAQVLDTNGRRAIQFALYRDQMMAKLDFELYRLTPEQFLDRYASGFRGAAGWEEERPIDTTGTSLAKSWTITTTKSPVEYSNVQEVIIPEDVTPGLYILNVKAGFLNDQLILLLTRNTVTVKQAEGQIVAWVTDINGGPVAEIEVAVYARDGELIANGRTASNGVFRTAVDRDPQPLIVIARDGEDITASGLSNEWRSRSNQWGGWWRGAPTAVDYAAYIYTDRPIYRPGHTVFFKAIIRQDDDAILTMLPEGTPVTVRIRDTRDNVVQTFTHNSNAFGTIHGDFQLAAGAMLGNYTVEVEIDGQSHRQAFKVEDYRKPDYQVEVTTNEARFIEGEQIQVEVEASYFFGEPVPNSSVSVRVYQLGQRYAWDDSNGGDYIWYEGYDNNVSNGRTDANGRYTLSIPATNQYHSQEVYWRSNLRQGTWAIEATVDDGSHQTVSSFAVVHVFNAAEKVRLDTNGYFHEPGKPFTVQADVHTIDDEPVVARSLTLSLRRWDRSAYDYNTVVQSIEITSDDNGRASTSLTVEEPGYYQLRASGRDRLGNEIRYETYLYAFSDSISNWYGRSDDLTISAEAGSYAPGNTARLAIESSFSGSALLTFERGTTRREQLIELTAPLTLVDVDILPDDAPNIYVTVNAWQEQDTTLKENMYQSLPDSRLLQDSINLSVPVTDKTLLVTITPDKETYAPREEATFTVRVTNQAGTPVSAELSLAMVDEAIFALSDDLSGHIFDAFYYERDNIVRTYDALALIRYLGGGGGGGGGGDLPGNPRSDFPDTAVWFPVLHTDFNGEATVTVTLPDSLTSWRLTAKATTADTQVGQTFTNILVQQEIVVRPILPRTLTAGDQVGLSAMVHNYSDQTQEIVVALGESDETRLEIQGPSTHTITLQPDELQMVGWPVTAVSTGEAQVVMWATVGDETKDAVQLALPVRPLAVPDVTTQVGQFRSELTTGITMPAAALPMSSVRLELSRSIAGTLLEGLEYLTGFPYGCVEQTMSRALPNAVVGRALHQLGVSNPTLQADLPAKINASLQRLYGYQHNDGGWGWWYDDSSHDYQTAWVVFGLAVMADAGYEVDSGVIERGVAWMNENLDQMDIRTRAYALYSMAVAGQPNVEATLTLAEELDELDTFSRAGLALALHEAGETAAAQEIVDVLAETAVVDNGNVYWAGDKYDGHYYRKTMASDTRNTALALSAFVQIRPGHELEAGMVRWLMGQRRQQGWGTTNETSYAILGLTNHLLATSFSEAATATEYTVFLNDEPLASGSLGRGEPAVSLEIPAAQLQTGDNALHITKSGSGQLYYVINNRVYVAQEAIEAAGVVEVRRVYRDGETNEPIETAVANQLVKVEIILQLPQDATYLIVEDNLPGGLEALNERLNTTSHVPGTVAQEPRWQSYGYNQKEIFGDRVTFFITEMDKGARTFTYLARATHTGEFVAMPVEVYAMYDLATWGRSASNTLAVTD